VSQQNDVTIRLGVDDSAMPAPVQRVNAAISSIGKTGEISARQTAAAMRQLPAQLTDVATQLAGGQNPLLVLLQQGGQVKDSFGGIGPALSGIAAAISPAAVAVAALTAGVGAFALAAYKGAEQDEALRDSIALTGNAAGLTGARLMALSDAVADNSQQTVGGARDIVLALSSSGQVSARVLESTATAVARVADVSGQSGTKVAADFATMAGGVAKWAAEHNKVWNFITVEQYRYIRRLEEQGKAEEAMIFTNQKVTSALEEQQTKLGTLERAWDSIGKAASGAWQSMLAIGREETLREKLEDAQRRLKELPLEGRNTGFRGISERRAAIQAEIKDLSDQLFYEQQLADARSKAAADNRRAIADERENEGKAAGKPYGADAKPYIPSEFQVLDARDGAILAARRDKEDSENEAFFIDQLRKQDERDSQRLDKNASYLQNLFEANQRASLELIEDERLRGEALIELDRQIALRRAEAQGLTGGALTEAQTLIDEQSAIARRRLEVELRSSTDKMAAEAGQATYDDVRSALQAAFQDTQNPVKAFAQALGNAVFTRLTASIADAMATAAVGKDGMGGFLGTLISMGKYSGTSSDVSAPNYENSFDLMAAAPPMATGTNYVPKNMLAYIHEGEAVVPKKYNPAAGGAGGGAQVTFAPQISIDSRTDREQVAQLVYGAVSESQQRMLEDLRARGVAV
jgi:phage-related minor tail protein